MYKLLYIGNIIPSEYAKKVNASVAGNKFEVNLIHYLNEVYQDNLEIFTTINIKDCNYIFNKKPIKSAYPINFPVVRDITLFFSVLLHTIVWIFKNKNHEKKILILNSPFSVIAPLIFFRILKWVKIFSLTIDTPIPNIQKKNKLYGFYQLMYSRLGHKLINNIDGIIVLNKNVIKNLKIFKIPFLISRIGYQKTTSEEREYKEFDFNNNKKILFAGTLIDYNGILELINGVKLLEDKNIDLHIFGYGILENEVIEITKKNKNIYFHGSIDNNQLINLYKKFDILVNTRILDNDVNDFGFPSKMIEFLISGKPVLTTKFSSMPDDYLHFVFLLNDLSPEEISQKIMEILSLPKEDILSLTENAKKYIEKKNKWEEIVVEMSNFINNN